MDNLRFYLALNRLPGVGPKTASRLIEKWPDLSHLFALHPHQMQACGLPPVLADAIHQFNLAITDTDFIWAEQANCHLIHREHPQYPSLLKQIPSAPLILYAHGNLNAFNKPCIAMVGSRKPSLHGQENAFRFAQSLSQQGFTIVSGLALGIDAQSHLGCLNAQGATIAVMGTGIDQIYPRHHAALAEKIVDNGLLLSEFPLKTCPKAGHFPQRNRIISGLSLATLVVEAAMKSGSLITARLALEQNREVLAIPGSIHSPTARGCNYLLQQGAKLVTRVEDILEELGILRALTPQVSTNATQALASHTQILVQFMGFEQCSIDQLCEKSGHPAEEIAASLAELELLGIVKAVNGDYIRVKQ